MGSSVARGRAARRGHTPGEKPAGAALEMAPREHGMTAGPGMSG